MGGGSLSSVFKETHIYQSTMNNLFNHTPLAIEGGDPEEGGGLVFVSVGGKNIHHFV